MRAAIMRGLKRDLAQQGAVRPEPPEVLETRWRLRAEAEREMLLGRQGR